MNRIRLLPEQVANQIAAGEVVERPASVVKELVENALDAASRRIHVEIQAGGRSLIRVTDDGTGMNRDDALLCLERHATSKIRRAEDLSAIATMGFRGEAIPSIASVSRMTITTREQEGDATTATQIIINGGKILEVKAAGTPPGTCIEVRQLFFNLPARRKFLRSEETEYSHIHHYLTLAALAYPEVSFTFTKDARNVWQLPEVAFAESPAARLNALGERIRGLSGNLDELMPIDFSAPLYLPQPDDDPEPQPSSEHARLRLWGYLGRPGASRSTRQDQHLFVNRRPVDNRALNYALIEGYHTALMKGRYPVCTLFLETDPATVDVNIHPAKREVKFRNERAVRNLVTQAVRERLLQYHSTTVSRQETSPASNSPKPTAQAMSPADSPTLPSQVTVPQPGPSARTETPNPAPFTPAPKPSTTLSPPDNSQDRSTPPTWKPAPPGPLPQPGRDASPKAGGAGAGATPLLGIPLRLVGVVGKLYVVLESDRGLVLLDQHAAHERVLFEQMLARMEQGEAASQRLLLPETVEVSVRDAQFLREHLPTLTRLGVGLSEFGERTFLLDAIPPFVKGSDPRRFVLELVDELKAAGEGVNNLRLGESTIAKTVCRHAVKANDPLAEPELEKLIEDLRRCAMPYTCPHGRPTLLEMGYRELERKFGRQTS